MFLRIEIAQIMGEIAKEQTTILQLGYEDHAVMEEP